MTIICRYMYCVKYFTCIKCCAVVGGNTVYSHSVAIEHIRNNLQTSLIALANFSMSCFMFSSLHNQLSISVFSQGGADLARYPRL